METTFTDRQMVRLMEMMRQKGMTEKRLDVVLKSEILADVFDPNADLGNREAVRAALGLGVLTPAIFPLTANYGMSLEAMIAAGLYGRIKRGVDWKRFRNSWLNGGIVRFDARYFGFNHDVSSEYAVKAIVSADDLNPWRPAGIEPLLALGAAFPEEQRKFNIVALGSSANIAFSGPHAPYLGQVKSVRNLDLYRLKDSLPPVYRFLAVRVVDFVSLAA